MPKLSFTSEQVENLKSWKNNLETERAKKCAIDQDNAEISRTKLLNDTDFKSVMDLTLEELDELFSDMRVFSNNRNLSKRLYQANGNRRISRGHSNDNSG